MSNESLEQVKDWMTTDVKSLRVGQSVSDAIDLLLTNRIKSAPVLDEEGRLVGVISEADLIASETEVHIPTMISVLGEVAAWPPSILRFKHDVERSTALTVDDAMSKAVHSISPDATIAQAAGVLFNNKVVMLPVVMDSKVVGVLGRSDVLRSMAHGEAKN